jgi:signal transduction histidine kinase
MTIAAYVPLAAALLNALLSLFVLRAGVQGSSKFAYLLWGASITIWNFGTFQLFRVASAEAALDWARFLQLGVIFLPISLFHLCTKVCGLTYRSHRLLLATFYGCGIALALTLFTTWFVADVRDAGYAWYSVGGPAFWIYALLYLAVAILTLILLWRAKANATRFKLGQIRALLWATSILIAGGSNDLLPIIGVHTYPILGKPIFPIGSLCAIFYGILVGYSVLEHQLLDIHIGLSRVAAHVLRMAFLFLIGFTLMLIVSLLAPENAITPFAFWTSLGVLLASGLAATRWMPKLLGAGSESLERRLLGDHFEYQDKIRAFIERCRWQTEMDALLMDLHLLLVNTLKVRAYWLILLDETSRAFTLARAHPEDSQPPIPDFQADSPAFRVFTEGRRPYLSLRSGIAGPPHRLDAAAREQLKMFPGEFAFPLIVTQQPVGLLIIGEKASGKVFTSTDTQLLISLAENIALIVNQISLKNQLLLTKELDLLGRMSRGMAHDLNNLTTPVWTLLQLLADGVPSETLRTELAPVATRNLQTMRDYIKEALFFSENLRPDFQAGRLDSLVQGVVESARQNRRKGKNINYELVLCGEVPVEMDQILIRRLLSNIIANAVDASPDPGSIRVEVIRLVKTEADRDWIRVRVTDHGSGIQADNLNRIFQPYFTTKKTGDEDRGFGLGLAICRKIATLHEGNLFVSSEVGKRTIVNLDLPSRQKKPRVAGSGMHAAARN